MSRQKFSICHAGLRNVTGIGRVLSSCSRIRNCPKRFGRRLCSYTVGQDVPLHLAIEDVSATRSLYSPPVIGGACPPDFTVHVEKEDGSRPELFQLQAITVKEATCVAGYSRKPLVQGKIVPIEDTLYHLG